MLNCQTKLDTDSLPIIDAHTHTEFTGEIEESSGIPMTREEYFREWREAGVVGAVAHAHEDESDYVKFTKENVVCCAGVENHLNAAKLEANLKAKKYRCIKIYLGYVHRYAYDKYYEPVYKLAKKFDVPVVFHTGDTYSTTAMLKYADPLTIDEVAVKHPDVTFVIAHCGNPWIESAAEVAYKNPNVYLDGSAFLIGNSDIDSMKAEKYIVHPLAWIHGYVEDSTKLMFGTDWPLANMKSTIAAFKRAIPRKDWRAVFYDNAARVFKFAK
ncbi:MAG: amidohydrolase family protein [Ignavibacteriae bacterium]|nr:amidohydrolase family protein [Ignavibacteria bacterium]MBI3363446.1 amidohydrolase family protein [Ignavibacteriota bacterium]